MHSKGLFRSFRMARNAGCGKICGIPKEDLCSDRYAFRGLNVRRELGFDLHFEAAAWRLCPELEAGLMM